MMKVSENNRNKMLNKMYKMANLLVKEYSWELNNKLWEMSSEWNDRCYDENKDYLEIAMYEHANDDGVVDGFYIEDDYWILED